MWAYYILIPNTWHISCALKLRICQKKKKKELWKLAKLSFHKWFLISVANKDIPRLHSFVKLALGNKKGVEHILDKYTQAINGFYRAKCNADDKDLVFLILKFGGPSILDILHHAKCYLITSVAYRMNKECPPIKSSVYVSVNKCFKANFLKDFSLQNKKFLFLSNEMKHMLMEKPDMTLELMNLLGYFTYIVMWLAKIYILLKMLTWSKRSWFQIMFMCQKSVWLLK